MEFNNEIYDDSFNKAVEDLMDNTQNNISTVDSNAVEDSSAVEVSESKDNTETAPAPRRADQLGRYKSYMYKIQNK